MRRTRWLRHGAVISVLALALAACGDNGDDPGDDDEVETPENGDDQDENGDDDDDGEAGDDVDIDRPERDEALNLGYLMPETGDLATLGVPQIAAIQMAIEDINEAGGVLGNDVTLATADEAGDGAAAREEVARLINDGVDAVVGAAASGMSQEVIDLTHDNEIVQCSASNTAPDFSDQANNSYYIRTVPPDEAVAPLIGQTVIGDGWSNVAVLARADDYGVALAGLVIDELEGQVDIALEEEYNPDDPDFGSLVTEVNNAGADSVVVVGFDEAHDLYRQLIEGGVDPGSMYGGDGLFGPGLEEAVGVDITGLKVIGAAGGEDFNERLNEQMGDSDQGNVIYGGQAYDCGIVIALAAITAGSTDPADFNDELEGVTQDGTECTSFEDCAALLEDGEDIDYVGVSGPLNLDRPDPTVGRYTIGEFTDGQLEIVGESDVDLSDL